MKNGSPKKDDRIIPNSFKAFSSYLRIVSSSASNVASTVRSAASAIVERDSETVNELVSWAGFDKLELEKDLPRQVLLLCYSYGFQIWDVEVADNVHNIVSRHDGPVSFMQIIPKPLNKSVDKFAESRPLLIICADGSFHGDDNVQEGSVIPRNGSSEPLNNGSCVPTVVWFYSLRSQSYVHLLRFRSVVHLVRCSSRVVAVLQSTQIHCFNAATLEKEYTILTNPFFTGCYGSGNIGFGPLAVGPRWIAYSGSQVHVSNSGRVSPQYLTSSSSFPSPGANGSLVAHYAKESSKQLAVNVVTLGEIGYKKLSRYCSELLPEGNNWQTGSARVKGNGVVSGHSLDAENVGMVIVRDIVTKGLITQFRAHKSPISSLSFDPSGTLLVTASVQGHNINVFRITPGNSGDANEPSYTHIYRLQRGFTNAVIQDISFSVDSQWIMISSSRGTGHLFTISPPTDCFVAKLDITSPVSLSAVSRIRSGNSGWRNTVNPLSGAIASAFHSCKLDDDDNKYPNTKRNYHLLLFSSFGSLVQYALCLSPDFNGESGVDCEEKVAVEAIQKWNICHRKNRKDRENNSNTELYGENENSGICKVYPERMKRKNSTFKDADKIGTEERHHIYISEAELQMHENLNPLWSRSEIYFQSILTDGYNLEEEVAYGGEIEIEKFPVCTLQARTKDLIPVFDYTQATKIRQGRTPVMKGNDIIGNESCNGVDQSTDTSSRGDFVNTTDCQIVNRTVYTRKNLLGGGLKLDNQITERKKFD